MTLHPLVLGSELWEGPEQKRSKMTFALFHLNINQVDAMRGPEVVAAVELEEDEEGEEKTRDPSYVCIHLGEGGRTRGQISRQ